jgi:hypothetical protein
MPGQGVKFFYKSYSDIVRLDLGQITVTLNNNDVIKNFMLDRSNFTKWVSFGADDDTISVTMTVDFKVNRFISDFFLINTNLKDFELEYWDGALWQSLIVETTNADTIYHNQFTGVNTTMVRLTMNTTITADQEKQIGQFIITEQIGQLEFRPFPSPDFDGNIIENKMLNGKSRFVFNEVQHQFTIEFRNYTNVNDRALIQTLVSLFDSFLVWPSGGDTTQFSFTDETYRLEDIFLMNLANRPSPAFTGNYYKAGTNADLVLVEVA